MGFYKAHVGAVGTDHLTYEVTRADGEVGTYDVTINIKNAPNPPADKRPEGNKI